MKFSLCLLLLAYSILTHSQSIRDKIESCVPEGFKYGLEFSSEYYDKDLAETKDSILIGCREGAMINILPDFKLSITKESKNQRFNVDLIGIKLNRISDKKTLIKAIDDYCVYGQANSYFESEDFLIFSYSLRSWGSMGQDNENWLIIKDKLVQGLSEQK